jgi:hypothetical protein
VFRKFVLTLCLASTMACLADGAPPAPSSNDPTDSGVPPEPVIVPDPASRHPQVLAKTGEMYSQDLATALSLPRDEVCKELGSYDCARLAHRIALGGVEPYVLRIDQPLNVTPVSAPLAVDRIALSACGARVRADFAAPGSAVIFGALAQGGSDGPNLAVRSLYDRMLGRDPDDAELSAVLELNTAPATPEEFGVLACFVIATSLENLFY